MWILKFHYHVLKCLPLDTILRHINLIRALISCLLWTHFNITLSVPGFPSSPFLSAFQTEILCVFPISSLCSCLAHLILVDLIILITSQKEYKLRISQKYLQPPVLPFLVQVFSSPCSHVIAACCSNYHTVMGCLMALFQYQDCVATDGMTIDEL